MNGWAKSKFTLRKLDIMWNLALLLRTVDPGPIFWIKSPISCRPLHILHINFQFEYAMKSIIWTQIPFRTPAALCLCMAGVLAHWNQGVPICSLKTGEKPQTYKKKPTLYKTQRNEILAHAELLYYFY